jgi:hypothetical protein
VDDLLLCSLTPQQRSTSSRQALRGCACNRFQWNILYAALIF